MSPVTVVKIGGALVEQPRAMAAFWRGVAALQQNGPVVIVHGGGPQVSALGRQLGHEPRFVQGRRVTSDLDLDLVRWALCGRVNSDLVAQAQSHGLDPVGLTGADAGTVRVTRRPPWSVDGAAVDFGWVGDVESVDPRLVRHLLTGGYLPIIATLGIDAGGQVYNVNGDTVTGAVAQALLADTLLLVTEVGQVQVEGARVLRLGRAQEEEGVRQGWLRGGMRVKVHVGLAARAAGVPSVHIVGPDDLVTRSQGTELILDTD